MAALQQGGRAKALATREGFTGVFAGAHHAGHKHNRFLCGVGGAFSSVGRDRGGAC